MFIKLHTKDDDGKCPLINIDCIRNVDTDIKGGFHIIEISFKDGATKDYIYRNHDILPDEACMRDYELLTKVLLEQKDENP